MTKVAHHHAGSITGNGIVGAKTTENLFFTRLGTAVDSYRNEIWGSRRRVYRTKRAYCMPPDLSPREHDILRQPPIPRPAAREPKQPVEPAIDRPVS